MYYVKLNLGSHTVNAKIENISTDDFLDWITQMKSQDKKVKVESLSSDQFKILSKNRPVSQKRMFRKISSNKRQYFGTMTSYRCN